MPEEQNIVDRAARDQCVHLVDAYLDGALNRAALHAAWPRSSKDPEIEALAQHILRKLPAGRMPHPVRTRRERKLREWLARVALFLRGNRPYHGAGEQSSSAAPSGPMVMIRRRVRDHLGLIVALLSVAALVALLLCVGRWGDVLSAIVWVVGVSVSLILPIIFAVREESARRYWPFANRQDYEADLRWRLKLELEGLPVDREGRSRAEALLASWGAGEIDRSRLLRVWPESEDRALDLMLHHAGDSLPQRLDQIRCKPRRDAVCALVRRCRLFLRSDDHYVWLGATFEPSLRTLLCCTVGAFLLALGAGAAAVGLAALFAFKGPATAQRYLVVVLLFVGAFLIVFKCREPLWRRVNRLRIWRELTRGEWTHWPFTTPEECAKAKQEGNAAEH